MRERNRRVISNIITPLKMTHLTGNLTSHPTILSEGRSTGSTPIAIQTPVVLLIPAASYTPTPSIRGPHTRKVQLIPRPTDKHIVLCVRQTSPFFLFLAILCFRARRGFGSGYRESLDKPS